MTGQRRPDEMIRILRAEFVTKPGGVPGGGSCVTFTCGATGWRGAGGTIVRTLVHEVAFQLDVGGNARGTYAIDLQQHRSNAIEVASGEYSFVVGRDNSNPGDYCAIFGYNNDILSQYATYTLVFGSGNQTSVGLFAASGPDYSLVFGKSNFLRYSNHACMVFGENINVDSSGLHSLWFGEDHIQSGLSGLTNYCFVFGLAHDTTLNTQYSSALGRGHITHYARYVYAFGYGTRTVDDVALSYYLKGRIVWNSGVKTNAGDNQCSKFSQRWTVTNWTVAWQSAFQYPIPVDTVWTFTVKITGTEQGCVNSYSWKLIDGVIENDGGNCTILAVPTVTNIYRDVATKEWQAIADNVNDRLVLQYRDTAGPDATDCNITIEVETQEVTFT